MNLRESIEKVLDEKIESGVDYNEILDMIDEKYFLSSNSKFRVLEENGVRKFNYSYRNDKCELEGDVVISIVKGSIKKQNWNGTGVLIDSFILNGSNCPVRLLELYRLDGKIETEFVNYNQDNIKGISMVYKNI